MTISLLGRGWLGVAPRGHTGRLARYAGPLFAITVAFTMFEQVDVILIGAIISTTAVGVFEAPMRLTPSSPTADRHWRSASLRGSRAAVAGRSLGRIDAANRYLIILQATFLAPILVWTQPIVDLVLGPALSGSVSVLRALAPFVFLSGIGTFITIAVNYVGEARRRVLLSFVTVAINAAIDIVLLPRIGVVGGAIGTDMAYASISRGTSGSSSRSSTCGCRRSRDGIRCLAAAAAMAGAMALVGTSIYRGASGSPARSPA